MESFKKNFSTRLKEATKRIFRFDFHPRGQWRRLVILTLVLGLVTAGVQMYLFYRVEGHTIFNTATTTDTAAPVVNEARLTAVLKKFEDKALVRSSAVQLVPVVSEPSH